MQRPALDVRKTSGFGNTYRAWHGHGTVGADAAASHLVGLPSDIVTDPDLPGWSDKLGLEMADKCVWTYGRTYTAANGRHANFKFCQRDNLIRQLWVPSKAGGACQMRP